ncbi:MAG: porin family protein [Flavobacteriales bacterium]
MWRSILSSKGYLSLSFLFILISFSFTGLSQLEFSGGLELGVSTTQFSGDALSGFDKFGLSAGPFIRTTFSEKSSAKLGILYLNKGSKKNADPDNGDLITYAIRLNYVEVPITYSYSINNIRAEGGLAIARLVSSSELGTDGRERDFIFPFEKMDFSVVLGASYYFSENIFVNGRWSQSIIPVRKSPNVLNSASFYEAGMYNTAFQLMFGYEF